MHGAIHADVFRQHFMLTPERCTAQCIGILALLRLGVLPPVTSSSSLAGCSSYALNVAVRIYALLQQRLLHHLSNLPLHLVKR